MNKVQANALEMGDIPIRPSEGGADVTVPCALLLQFDSPEDLRKALEERSVDFTLFGE